MPNYREKISAIRDKAVRYLTSIGDDGEDPIPKEGLDVVGQYVTSLWTDAKEGYENAFAETKLARFEYSSPEAFIQACQWLDNGNDWEAWGHRDEVDYEQEFTDGDLGDQLRARNAYFNSNWHDVTISPNLNGINEIFDQERKATKWGKTTRRWTRYMQSFGDVWIKSCLDKNDDPNGIAREILCRPLSVFITPNCESHEKIAGCWYLVHGEQVNDKWVKNNYKGFDLGSATDKALSNPEFTALWKSDKEFSHTKMFNKIELYLDDDSFEDIPFTQEMFDQRIAEVLSAQGGIQPGDNHVKFLRAYDDWLAEKEKFYLNLEEKGELSQEDQNNINLIIATVTDQITAHETAIDEYEQNKDENDPPVGKRKKYPFGRHIVTINGVVAEDTPNPYADKENGVGRDWRVLWHHPKNEEVPERIDGRGDIEILWNGQKVADTMLSHFADDEVLNMHRKPYLTEDNKDTWEKQGADNDPKKPFFYRGQPPIFQDASGGGNSLKMYELFANSRQRKLGINQTTYGQPDPNVESGKQAQINLSQNETIITGEANHNINDVIEDIVETRIYLWKMFYTNPRTYIIDGEQMELILAHYLKEVDKVQVTVRPYSNFPMRWENDLAVMSQVASLMNSIPPESPFYYMILDQAAQRFPALAKGGKYRQLAQATQIGMQVMQQQQQAQQAQRQQIQGQEKDQNDIMDRMTNKLKNQIAEQALNGTR